MLPPPPRRQSRHLPPLPDTDSALPDSAPATARASHSKPPPAGTPLADRHTNWAAELRHRTASGQAPAAVGETVILLTPPVPPLLKRLLKGEGGAAQ